jgi:hypothetical protein
VSGRDVAAVARGKSRPYNPDLDVDSDGDVDLRDLFRVIRAMHRDTC